MIRVLGRVIGSLLRLLVLVAALSMLVSAAVSTGALDVGLDDGDRIETPDPLPDWPFVWEVELDDRPEVDPGTTPSPVDEEEHGDPVREDPGTTSLETDGSTVSSDEIESRVHERINAIRDEEELSRLAHDDEIASIARTHSHDMAEREYFGHVSPEGETPADRFGDRYPRDCRAVGENLAFVGTRTGDADAIAERIVDGWMDSEGHRENVLAARWDAHGIGVYVEDDGRVYAAQKFCERR